MTQLEGDCRGSGVCWTTCEAMTTNHLNRTTPAQTGGVGQTPERGPRAAKEKMGGEFFASGESSSGDEGVLQQILQNHTVPQPKTLQQAPSAASPTQAGTKAAAFCSAGVLVRSSPCWVEFGCG